MKERVFEELGKRLFPCTVYWLSRRLSARPSTVLLALVELEKQGRVQFCFPSQWSKVKSKGDRVK